MTVTVDEARRVLGIGADTEITEAEMIYNALLNKYQQECDAGNQSAVGEINKIKTAWNVIKEAAIEEEGRYACRSRITGEIYVFKSKFSIIFGMIVSFALFGAALYGLVLLIHNISGDLSFLDYFSKGLLNLTDFFVEQLKSLKNSTLGDFIFCAVSNSNESVYAEDEFLQQFGIAGAMLTASCLTIVVMLFLSFVLNLFYLIYTEKIYKVCGDFTAEETVVLIDAEYKVNMIFKIINASYAVLSYISLALILSTSWYLAFWVSKIILLEPVLYIPLISVTLVVFFKIVRIYITDKLKRISNRCSYEYRENLWTYLIGVVIFVIPAVVSYFGALIIALILSLILYFHVCRNLKKDGVL